MVLNIARYIAVAFFVFLMEGLKTPAQTDLIKNILQSTQQQYAPDRRTTVFDISYKQTKKGIVIIGEVDNFEVKNAVIHTLQKNIKEEVFDNIRVLPDSTLGQRRNGIVILSVGNVRCKPSRQGKLSTQALMGTVVKLLKEANGYYYVQMPDKYLGWMDARSMYITDQAGVEVWNATHKVIVTELKSFICERRPEPSSLQVCDVVAGCILKSNGKIHGWTSVEIADARKGFIPDSVVQNLDEWNTSRILNGENLEKTAKALLGIPYLWGGTSVKAMDCSGFVKMVYRLNGMELSRDANQQAEQGTHIDPGKDFKNLQKGDLLFFGHKSAGKKSERITHVGIYLEHGLFIHSSRRVRLSSFDPTSKYFEQSLLARFIRARRLF